MELTRKSAQAKKIKQLATSMSEARRIVSLANSLDSISMSASREATSVMIALRQPVELGGA
jgi:hypothetical protein